MKKVIVFVSAALMLVIGMSVGSMESYTIEKYNSGLHKNANGAPTGQTGAPGETNCTSCHAGSVQAGSTENSLIVAQGITPVSAYVPGVTYNVALQMTSSPAKKGFQATALTAASDMAGTFGAGSNTAITGTTRKYANHKSTSNTSATVAWLWTWTAPATDVGPVTFYVASNKANGNSTNSGDVIYLSTHVLNSTLGLEEEVNDLASNFTAGYSPENKSIVLNFNSMSVGEMYLNLIDLNGKSVFVSNLGNSMIGQNKQTISVPSELKSGIYVVNFFVGNKAMTAKVMI
ncbi:MAG: hypothetical protein RI922_443 [Bacteroidota bacterium]|jgi:hypothetical protein